MSVERLRVNLGCGDRYADGWVNVDLPTNPHRVDVVADLRKMLPFTELSLTHVYAGHVLEHLTPIECVDLLTRLLTYVMPDGELMIVGPDIPTAEAMIANGAGLAEMWGATLESLKHGAGRWAGDEHHWEWSAERTAAMLWVLGWWDVTEVHINDVGEQWPVADRRPQWQRAVWARRPSETVR